MYEEVKVARQSGGECVTIMPDVHAEMSTCILIAHFAWSQTV